MPNNLCHFEFMSANPAKSREFYSKIFDWKFTTVPEMGGYVTIDAGTQPGGGLMEKPKQAPQPALNVYFQVEDVNATLGKARGAGAKVINEKTAIPGIGSWATFFDPDGICVGIFEPEKKQ